MNQRNSRRADALVGFYRFWHGRLHFKGAGVLLRLGRKFFSELEHYHLSIPAVGSLTVNLKDDSGIAWLNYALGDAGHEEGIVTAIKTLAPPNPVIWDIGANAGFFATDLARKIGEYAGIHLFEPNPGFTRILHQLAGHLDRIYVHPLALSNTPGRLTLHVPRGFSCIASLDPKPDAIPVPVECTTVDLFLETTGTAEPDVVVIDTEGNDARVIQGMAGLIQRKRPVIFFENIFLAEEIIQAQVPPGYQLFTVADKTGALLAGLHQSAGHNSVYVPR